MSSAIRTEKLTKAFGSRKALLNLELEVEEGRVFGFIGPNGAGKTTTIRLLLGLARPTEGKCFVLGAEIPREYKKVFLRVSGVWESAAFYPTISARNNLRLLAMSSGNRAAVSRIDGLMAKVGLADRGNDRLSKYSHGMRQRLGLAAALLHDPDLLVLDEPHTGLDPSGIKDFRDLIASLAEEGRTVFFSSHILSEVEQICTEVAFLRKGELVGLFDVGAIRRGQAVRVLIDNPPAGAAELARRGWKVNRQGAYLIVEGASRDEVRDHLVDRGHRPVDVASQGIALEQLYADLVERQE